MKARSDWFTIVATDLFAASFAAILIIDSVTPKEIAGVGQPQIFQLEYQVAQRKPSFCKNEHALAFFATDNSGAAISTIPQKLSASRVGNTCKVIGLFPDSTLSAAPDDGVVIVVELDPAMEPIKKVSIKIGEHTLKCKENELCTP